MTAIPEGRVLLGPRAGKDREYVEWLCQLCRDRGCIERLADWASVLGFVRPACHQWQRSQEWAAIESALGPTGLLTRMECSHDLVEHLSPEKLRKRMLELILTQGQVHLANPQSVAKEFVRRCDSRAVYCHDPYAAQHLDRLGSFLREVANAAKSTVLIVLVPRLNSNRSGLTQQDMASLVEDIRTATGAVTATTEIRFYTSVGMTPQRCWSHSRWLLGSDMGIWIDTGFIEATHQQSLVCTPIPAGLRIKMRTWADTLRADRHTL